LLITIFESVVIGFHYIDAVTFDADHLDGSVGVNEFVDGMDFHLFTVDEGFSCGGET
jgi:hypothetical protein